MRDNISGQDKIEFLISVSNLTFLSFEEKNIIFKNVDDAFSLSVMNISDIGNLVSRSIRARFDGANNLLLAQRAAKVINSLGIVLLQNSEPNFPAILREIHDAPFMLYCRGDISCLRQKSVSVVGTREITTQGRIVAKKFAHDAAADGYTVISGLAYGVDGEVHKGAIDAYYDALESSDVVAESVGKTCAVLPGGVDDIVPYGHKRLAQKIVASGGLLVSECPPCVPVEKWRFVSRNRIIAALSPATVVVEAPPASGALITAEFAVGYGREVVVLENAFCDAAKKISEQKRLALAAKKTQKKHITTLEQFVEDGAPVVRGFESFRNIIQ